MRFIFALITVLLLTGTIANAAPPTAEERAAKALAVYDDALGLSDEQSQVLEKSLIRKYEISKEAFALKKAGEEAKGKRMNQNAGREFQRTLRATLTKDQMSVYQDQREAIRKELQVKD